MCDREPLRAAGSVYVQRGEAPVLGGTCFAFRHANRLLTAGHCVEGLEPKDVAVAFFGGRESFSAVDVQRHPTADLALILLAAGDGPSGVEPFGAHAHAGRGEDFAAIGSIGGAGELFGGRIRRVFTDPEDGHRYAEMSVAARDGFSGGPLFSPAAPHAVVGVMTANLTTRLALTAAALLAHVRPGAPVGKAAGRGVALLVGELADWLDEHVPAEPQDLQEPGLHPEPGLRSR